MRFPLWLLACLALVSTRAVADCQSDCEESSRSCRKACGDPDSCIKGEKNGSPVVDKECRAKLASCDDQCRTTAASCRKSCKKSP